ncbi:MAG: 3-isopropylmalate/(R)-2-methylmalate dehydratase large subunit [Thermoanaerobacteraceae bacterium]|nr:3-isopropylmalate/(R)-2-methylmalate dehydratase large subunit [Thermoanaerobacteraceae bacterium]
MDSAHLKLCTIIKWNKLVLCCSTYLYLSIYTIFSILCLHAFTVVQFTKNWAKQYGIKNYFEYEGPCHQIMAENGFFRPSTLVVGTDSHTCMGGAFGAFATGIGSTEMLGVLISGEIWLKVPQSIKIVWNGKLPKGVYAKDIVLYDCCQIGHSGATYMALEYSGDTISNLIMDERMTISNMAVEMGAKVGLLPADEITIDYLKKIGITDYEILKPDEDAKYIKTYFNNSDYLVPQVACPHNVDNVKPVDEIEGERIDQAYIGSCTGGRFSDLEAAAEVLKDKKIAPGMKLLISPASKKIYLKAIKEGILEILADAGATIVAPSCGLCVGAHTGILAAGERCISSTNRNFIGRMGSKKAEVFLASAATVAASALEGKIADPRKYIK